MTFYLLLHHSRAVTKDVTRPRHSARAKEILVLTGARHVPEANKELHARKYARILKKFLNTVLQCVSRRTLSLADLSERADMMDRWRRRKSR
jgi:hypothetical protein